MPRMLAEPIRLSITNPVPLSADDELGRALTLAVVGGRNENLRQMMTGAPGRSIDRLHLKEVSTCADIAEGGDVVAEGSLLAGHLEILHQREVVLGELCHGPAAAADEHKDVGGMRVATGGGSCGSLGGDGE